MLSTRKIKVLDIWKLNMENGFVITVNFYLFIYLDIKYISKPRV